MADMAIRQLDGSVDDYDVWAQILDADEMPPRPEKAPPRSEESRARVRELVRAKLKP